jgi:hypothetical protein
LEKDSDEEDKSSGKIGEDRRKENSGREGREEST